MIQEIFQSLRSWLLQVIYPEGAICLYCGKISQGDCLCPDCRRNLENGEILESWQSWNLDGVPTWSLRPHRGIPRQLVLRLKYGAERRAAEELTRLLRCPPDYFPPFAPETVVTWVPMPRARRRERCIDHGRILAECTARELGLECRELLIRHGGGETQARLNRADRQRNLRHAYGSREEICRPVLLVDDVLTTGTTARRCIQALREGGAREITVLTMTKALEK